MASNFDCPKCGALTQYNLTNVTENRDQAAYGEAIMNVWLQCVSCTYVFGGVAGRYDQTRLLDWWPRRILAREFPDVPPHIASAATEAYTCLGVGAYRAAGSMARSVIEAVAKDKEVTRGRLVTKIDEMHRQEMIRRVVKDGAHEVRHLGNDMAHGDFVDPVSLGHSWAWPARWRCCVTG